MTAALLAVSVWLWGTALRPLRRPPPGGGGTAPPVRSRRRTGETAPSGDDWARLLDDIAARVRGGSTLRVAAMEAGHRHGAVPPPGPDGAVVLQVLTLATHLGGATAAIVHAGASLLRERAAARSEARAHSAQARLSARVLTLVPGLFTAWSAVMSTSFRAALATTPGAVAVTAGLCCNLTGWWWMRRIVAKAVR